MLTAEFLSTLQLNKFPSGQIFWARFLSFNYGFPPRTEIVVEGLDNLPTDRQVFLAMNHTDRYNSWPIQHYLHRKQQKYTCTWVKGKYYLNPVTRSFLLSTNNIPLASRGYVISSRFKKETGRNPNTQEYRLIRDWMDEQLPPDKKDEATRLLADYLGKHPEERIASLYSDFANMSDEVIRLNEQALELGHHILVFPEGTRSVRLGKGHVGLAQMAQRLGVDIVPIGCSGSNSCYPGAVPWARRGRIVYRIGEPIRLDSAEFKPFRVTDSFVPFSDAARQAHGQSFQALTDILMNRINDLVDPQHKRDSTQNRSSEGNPLL